jgi:hypothetical protein
MLKNGQSRVMAYLPIKTQQYRRTAALDADIRTITARHVERTVTRTSTCIGRDILEDEGEDERIPEVIGERVNGGDDDASVPSRFNALRDCSISFLTVQRT